MRKVYSHTSLRKAEFYKALLALFIFAAIIFLINYCLFTVEPTDFKPLVGALLVILVLFIARLSNIIVLSDTGIKAYGLFYRERFIAWSSIKHIGFIDKGWTVKPTDTPGKGNVFIVLTELDNCSLMSDLKNKRVIQLPYRKDVYELILSRIEAFSSKAR